MGSKEGKDNFRDEVEIVTLIDWLINWLMPLAPKDREQLVVCADDSAHKIYLQVSQV